MSTDILHPALAVEATGPAMAHEEDTLTYTVVLRNTGDADLNVSLPLPDGTTWMGALAAGESRTLAVTGPVSGDPTAFTFVGTGVDALGGRVAAQAPVSTDILHPALAVEATGPAMAHEGDTLTYTVVLRNTGDADLAVSLPLPDGTTWTGVLRAGESRTLAVTGPVSGDPTAFTFVGTGVDALGGEVSAQALVSTDILHPALAVEATGPAMAHEGDTLTYTVVLRNTGDADLNVSLPLPDGTTWMGALAPGESRTLAVTGPVSGDPTAFTFVGTGVDALGGEVSAQAPVSTDILHPALAVEATGPAMAHEGDTLTYTVVLRNTGDADLNVSLPLPDSTTWTGVLRAGESRTLAVTGPVSGDPTAFTFVGTGVDALGGEVSAQAPVSTDILHPALAVSVSAPLNQTYPGTVITLTCTVTNTGDTPLSGVVVRWDNGTPDDPDDDPILCVVDSLGVGEAASCSVPAAPEEATTYTATAIGTDALGGQAEDSESISIGIIPTEPGDTDGDGTPDYLDADSDGDGIPDWTEGAGDTDGDGDPDYLDADSDGDGIPDAVEGTADTDSDGLPDYLDADSDGDGIPDAVEGTADLDGDGLPNYLDTDSDSDGILDSVEGVGDPDSDGLPNYLDTDSDGDGIPDAVEGTADTDSDGLPNYLDADSDGDGIPDAVEGAWDADGDGTPNYLDLDSDGDGKPDAVEGTGDDDGDGIPNYLDPDDTPAPATVIYRVYLPFVARNAP